jgi:hypothetical protein
MDRRASARRSGCLETDRRPSTASELPIRDYIFDKLQHSSGESDWRRVSVCVV